MVSSDGRSWSVPLWFAVAIPLVTGARVTHGQDSQPVVNNVAVARLTETATPTVAEAGEDAVTEGARGLFDEILDAIVGGDVTLDLRFRAEIVEQERTDTAQAYTERTRLGYGTRPLHGLSFHLDIEDIRAADYDLYNAAGLNGEPNKAVVADPEDTELN